MALLSLLFVLVQSLIQYPQPAGDGLDEATHRRMRERQELLDREMARLLQELEQGPLEQQDEGWGAMLFGAWQHWPLWVLAGILLLLSLWFDCRKRSCEVSNSNKDQSSCKTFRDKTVTELEEDTADPEEGGEDSDMILEADDSDTEYDSGFTAPEEATKEVLEEDGNDRNKDEEQADVNVEGNKNKDRKEKEQGNVAASEKGGSDGGREEGASGGIEDTGDSQDGNEQDTLLVDDIQWSGKDLERGCSVTAELMESFTRVFVESVSNSFDPVPQEAIGVGSAFEGWSPPEWDGVFRVLVPLNPPPGHAFHLEPNSAGQTAARTFSVRVELVCTCEREQLGEKLLCLLHHSQEELRQKHQRSLLEKLCTGSYLDVEKTSSWLLQLVRCSWLHVPQSYSWHLVFQPCSRSCQFQLSKGKTTLRVEMLFGVRQGDSDIFVVSQPTEAQEGNCSNFVSGQPTEANMIASTVWLETFAVAEAKFFRHIARQKPCKSLHLKHLQLFTCMLGGTGFSTSTWKTVVMHVLNSVPQDRWHRKEFALRLWDIMAFLEFCLKWKRLDHFVLGNEKLPADISLPPAMRKVKPLNLFEHLAGDPAAHREAMQACGQLRFRLWMLLSNTERSSLHRARLAKVTADGSHMNSA